MADDGSDEADWMACLSRRVIELTFARQYDLAREAIESARQKIASRNPHELIALTAFVENRMGHTEESVELMKQAVQERPDWLPHLYELSVYLMDMGRLAEADLVLDQLISLSELRNDPYFLSEAIFRKILCLNALERQEEAAMHKRKLPPDTSVFIGNRLYTLADLS